MSVHACMVHIYIMHTCMSRYVQMMFHVNSLMYHLGFSLLFCPAGWPASRDWLLLDDMPIQAP